MRLSTGPSMAGPAGSPLVDEVDVVVSASVGPPYGVAHLDRNVGRLNIFGSEPEPEAVTVTGGAWAAPLADGNPSTAATANAAPTSLTDEDSTFHAATLRSANRSGSVDR